VTGGWIIVQNEEISVIILLTKYYWDVIKEDEIPEQGDMGSTCSTCLGWPT
jgi:hypothetical protein